MLGGAVKFRREQHQGTELLRDSILTGDRDGYQVFAHGICPGGNCAFGGEAYKSTFRPVFRQQACSRCRFRITGPAFLVGLVHRLNGLMVEVKQSTHREMELRAQLEIAEDNNLAVGAAEAAIVKELEWQEELLAEWCAELATVKEAKAGLESQSEGNNLSLTTGLDASQLDLQIKMVHELTLIHEVVSDSRIILGASYEILPSMVERRNELLLNIAEQNDMSSWFYSLDSVSRKKALDAFGDIICGHVTEADQDPVEFYDALLNGQAVLEDYPRLTIDAQRLVEAFDGRRGLSHGRAK